MKNRFSLQIITNTAYAVLILIFAFFKVNIKITMFLSIVAAMGISILVQRQSIPGLLQALFYGFRAHDTDVAGMLNGGGMRSMISVCIIVLVSSSYSGIFENTKILVPIQNRMEMLERRIGIFGTTVVCSVVSTMLACNQTFAAILVQQIIGKMHTDKTEQMLNLEDSVILICTARYSGSTPDQYGVRHLSLHGSPCTFDTEKRKIILLNLK